MKLNNESIVRNNESLVRHLRDGQRGQSIVIMTLALVGLLGAVAIVIDIGRVYFAYQELQAATQAAALAGGTVLSNDNETASEAIATATSYSAVSGDSNANKSGLLTNVTISAAVKCLTSAAAVAEGVPPVAPIR